MWNNGKCYVTIMGEDTGSDEYNIPGMVEDDIPSFMIYDASSHAYYPAVASENNAWTQNNFFIIDSLNALSTCSVTINF